MTGCKPSTISVGAGYGWVCNCGDESISSVRQKATAERMAWLHRNSIEHMSGGVFDSATHIVRSTIGIS